MTVQSLTRYNLDMRNQSDSSLTSQGFPRKSSAFFTYQTEALSKVIDAFKRVEKLLNSGNNRLISYDIRSKKTIQSHLSLL
jgi:hypothetical protein